MNWEEFYIGLAEYWSRKSKDPSTKVGAIIVDPTSMVQVGAGYNGFPRGVLDDPEILADRPKKYQYTVHAELNAILNANGSTRGGWLYLWPLFSCHECAKAVRQAGIVRVVAPRPKEDRWMQSYDVALDIYKQSKIQVDLYD